MMMEVPVKVSSEPLRHYLGHNSWSKPVNQPLNPCHANSAPSPAAEHQARSKKRKKKISTFIVFGDRTRNFHKGSTATPPLLRLSFFRPTIFDINLRTSSRRKLEVKHGESRYIWQSFDDSVALISSILKLASQLLLSCSLIWPILLWNHFSTL